MGGTGGDTLSRRLKRITNNLRTLSRIINDYDVPGYRVKSGKFKGKSVAELKKVRDEILWRRGELTPQSPLDDASWETEGSGLGEPDADELINQLYVSLGSSKVGITLTKLRKQFVDLVRLLYNHGMINNFQRKKIFTISPSTSTHRLSLSENKATKRR